MKGPNKPHTFPGESDLSRTLYENSEIFCSDQVVLSVMGAQFLSSRRVSAWSGHGLTDWVHGVSHWACAEMSALII